MAHCLASITFFRRRAQPSVAITGKTCRVVLWHFCQSFHSLVTEYDTGSNGHTMGHMLLNHAAYCLFQLLSHRYTSGRTAVRLRDIRVTIQLVRPDVSYSSEKGPRREFSFGELFFIFLTISSGSREGHLQQRATNVTRGASPVHQLHMPFALLILPSETLVLRHRLVDRCPKRMQ